MDIDGNRLGWVDNTIGELTVESVEHRVILEDWVRANSPADVRPIENSSEQTDLEQPTETVEEPDSSAWVDLALNVPGQAVREQATETLEEMRERSRFWTGVARVMDVKTDERAWRKGAEGEESVGAKLNRLVKDGWYVLHSVPIGDKHSDIDHVVIGHGGVYPINTKNHPGKKIRVTPKSIRVDGYSVSYLHKSRYEGERVRKLLSNALGWPVPVKPALVLLTGTIIPNVDIKKQPDDVMILDRMNIPKVFLQTPKRLTPEQVSQVYEVARRSTTWI